MGGRGGSSGMGWKSQLKKMADRGAMPRYVSGDSEQQAKFFEEVDRLYPMPEAEGANIMDRGDDVYIRYPDSTTSRAWYPSGEGASEAEKQGVLKFALYNHGYKPGANTGTQRKDN